MKLFLIFLSILLISCSGDRYKQSSMINNVENKQYSLPSTNLRTYRSNVHQIAFSIPNEYSQENVVTGTGFSWHKFIDTSDSAGKLNNIQIYDLSYVEWYEKHCSRPDQIFRCSRNITQEIFRAQQHALLNKQKQFSNGEGMLTYEEFNGIHYYVWNEKIIGDDSYTRKYETYIDNVKIVISAHIGMNEIFSQPYSNDEVDAYFDHLEIVISKD